jgi:hypothetical protein
MTVKLEVQPEIEARIVELAKERGISVEEYLHAAILERVESEPARAAKKKSFEEFLDAMAYHGPIDPAMRTQKITREFIYGDHP